MIPKIKLNLSCIFSEIILNKQIHLVFFSGFPLQMTLSVKVDLKQVLDRAVSDVPGLVSD